MAFFPFRPKKPPGKYVLPKQRNEALRRDIILFVIVLIVAIIAVAVVALTS